MADEQQTHSLARAFRHEMPGPLERLPIYPMRSETQRLKFCAENITDLVHASEVHGAAVYVHHLFQQCQCGVVIFVHVFHHRLFHRRELRVCCPKRGVE